MEVYEYRQRWLHHNLIPRPPPKKDKHINHFFCLHWLDYFEKLFVWNDPIIWNYICRPLQTYYLIRNGRYFLFYICFWSFRPNNLKRNHCFMFLVLVCHHSLTSAENLLLHPCFSHNELSFHFLPHSTYIDYFKHKENDGQINYAWWNQIS